MLMCSLKGLFSHLCVASFTMCKVGIIVVLALFFAEKSLSQELTFSQLEGAFLTVNSQLPRTLGNGIEMTSVSINEKEVVFRYNVNDIGNGMSSISLDDPDTMSRMKALVSAIADDKDARMMLTSMAKMNIGLKMQMTSANTGKTLELDMSPEEVMDIATGPGITPLEWVRTWHQSMKSQLPLEMGMGLLMTNAILTDKTMQFVCLVNESMVSFDNILENKDNIRSYLCDFLFSGTDAVVTMQNTQMALAGLSLSYKYIGPESGKELSIDFSNQELLERMQLDMTEYSDSMAIEEDVDTVAIEW